MSDTPRTLIARLRHLSSRRITAEFRNALKEAADALETCRNQALEDAALKCEEISGNEPSGHSGRFGALDCAEAIRAMDRKNE